MATWRQAGPAAWARRVRGAGASGLPGRGGGGRRARGGIRSGAARALEFADGSFDAIVCLEAAGDICVSEADKDQLVGELFRVLRPGGHVGFSDLALRTRPSPAEDRALRAVLYHSG